MVRYRIIVITTIGHHASHSPAALATFRLKRGEERDHLAELGLGERIELTRVEGCD